MRAICSLLLALSLAGCGGSSSPSPSPSADGSSEGGDPAEGEGDWTPENTFGKEDFALIEAELTCVEGGLEGEARAAAIKGVLAKWEHDEAWVQSVRAQVKAEPKFADKFGAVMKKRTAEICAGGVPSPEFLGSLSLTAVTRPAADAPASSPEGTPSAEPTPAPQSDPAEPTPADVP